MGQQHPEGSLSLVMFCGRTRCGKATIFNRRGERTIVASRPDILICPHCGWHNAFPAKMLKQLKEGTR